MDKMHEIFEARGDAYSDNSDFRQVLQNIVESTSQRPRLSLGSPVKFERNGSCDLGKRFIKIGKKLGATYPLTHLPRGEPSPLNEVGIGVSIFRKSSCAL